MVHLVLRVVQPAHGEEVRARRRQMVWRRRVGAAEEGREAAEGRWRGGREDAAT